MASERDELPKRPTSTLIEAVRQVKMAAAEKSDVVVEMRDADHARLELLAEDLAELVEAVPVEDERFDFAISNGSQPRLWIDVTAHVVMAPDRRTYRFVRDTRLGRVVLKEATERQAIAEAVTTYVATRIHERELVKAGETVAIRDMLAGKRGQADAERIGVIAANLNAAGPGRSAPKPASLPGSPREDAPKSTPAHAEEPTPAQKPARQGIPASEIVWALIGAVVGAGALALLVLRAPVF
jgi:hypothetical protein